MRDALAGWHMGHVIAAYRNHPFHGRPLSQDLVGSWAGISQPQLSRLENGPPITDLAKLMFWARILRIPTDLLWFKLRDQRMASSILNLAREAAADSNAFVREVAAIGNRPKLLEQLLADVHRFAVAYLTAPPADVLADILPVRAVAFSVIRQERDPAEDKDLVLLTGYLSGILAYAALDLGFAAEAEANARAALLAADLAGHYGLRAWVRGTQSLIARWQGDYDAAYEFIDDGLSYAGEGTSAIRLRCGQAQCRAQLGDSAGTYAALDQAKREREKVRSPDSLNGMFEFPPAKQAYYSGSSLIWLPGAKHARIANKESESAIALWRDGPARLRSNTDEALARVYLATARFRLGDLDGVQDAIEPVLTIPLQERVSWQSKRLGRLANLMDTKRYRNSPTAERIRREIKAFQLSIPECGPP